MLRLEKGHIIVGQDTDGVTNALENRCVMGAPDGQAILHRTSAVSPSCKKQPRRQSLVGFSLPPEARLRPRESHLVLGAGQIAGPASRAAAGRRRLRVASVWRW